MPIQLPPKARAKVVRDPRRDVLADFDWLGLWALSVGFCALYLAGTANFVGGDSTGAAYILFGGAGIMALALHADAAPDQQQ